MKLRKRENNTDKGVNWTYDKFLSLGLPDTEENRLIFLQKEKGYQIHLMLSIPDKEQDPKEEQEEIVIDDGENRFLILEEIQDVKSVLLHKGFDFPEVDLDDKPFSELLQYLEIIEQIANNPAGWEK